ncbi:protein SHQ1 homolog isoform X2 [Pseudomyrmex gracilis]|uniref:protein SHQ1 homolog isoform X2 n=1 Tax=Pseudomyrmex gracilis TaxID=219809 RepID=UPI000994C17D|nr:protein SHQ1 homolog isoform X2 [Pseudomyrmex gracilis]
MLTPHFEISQTETEVVVIIHARYSNIGDTEVHVDGTDFTFYSSPYYLRLKLPGKIHETESSSGSYDCEEGVFALRFEKVNKGEHFENLDMITTLLVPSKKKTLNIPNIEVIGNPSADLDIDENLNDNDTTDTSQNTSNDTLSFPQSDVKEHASILIDSPKYGFANKISGALTAFESAWLKEIIDLPNPDVTPEEERKSLQEKRELEDFCGDHYMGDLMEGSDIDETLLFIAEWDTLKKDNITFNKTEADLLKELPNKSYLLNAEDIRKLQFNLVDILFASCYNHRSTLGENTVESCWTINKLSSTLCWFRNFNSMDEVITSCFRRALCYPLFRNWSLNMEVLKDVKKVLALGKKYVIKRFCEIHTLFNNSYEPRYVLNQLYIKDFLIWLQSTPPTTIESLCSTLNAIQPTKASMEFDLEELEAAAYSVLEEVGLIIENNHKLAVDEAAEEINKLTIDDIKVNPNLTDTGSDSESSTTSSNSTTTSSSLDSDDLSDSDQVEDTNALDE